MSVPINLLSIVCEYHLKPVFSHHFYKSNSNIVNMVDVDINFLSYMNGIEEKIGQNIQEIIGKEKNFADGIFNEQLWFDVVIKEINKISFEIANEIQHQTGAYVEKTDYKLDLREAPFHRLLALEIGLAAWLGWIFNEREMNKTKPFSAPDVFKMIQAAFDYGERLSEKYHPKGIKQIIEEKYEDKISK
jgi:hypothetical protein